MFGKIDKEFLEVIHEKLLKKNQVQYDFIFALNKEYFASLIKDFIIERDESELKLESLTYKDEYVVLKVGDVLSKIYFNEHIPFGKYLEINPNNLTTMKYPWLEHKYRGLKHLGGVING